jgi:UDP-GlcNAc:undecaprenyl-phosphate GlcNAc-1-phosphate transferase
MVSIIGRIPNMFFEDAIGSKRELSWVVQFWPVLVTALGASLAATWTCKKIALKLGIVDKPDNLVKTHKEPVAYLGGIGILAGLAAGIITGIYMMQGQEGFSEIFKWLIGILVGAIIACVVGAVDDIVDIRPIQKVIGQLIAAVALILVGIVPALHYFTDPTGWEMPKYVEIILGIPVVIIFVLGATNSLNLLDGLDGLCAGVTAVITIAMLLLATHLATWGASDVGDPAKIIVCLALVGGTFGFLPFNRHPAKIFMGDAGSMLLGFTVAALMIMFGMEIPRWWMASIVVFGLPIMDTATALVRRIVNKKPVMVSDRGHIYDQMIDRGIPLKRTVKICYLLSAMYAVIGLSMSQISTRYAAVIHVLVFIGSALVIWKKGFLKMEGLRGAIRKDKE